MRWADVDLRQRFATSTRRKRLLSAPPNRSLRAAVMRRPARITAAVSRSGLTLDEREYVRVDDVRMGRHQAMREAGINLERGMLEQFGLQQ